MNQTFNCLFGSYSKLLVCANDISLDVSYAKRMTDCKQIKEVVVCNNYPLSYDNVVYENVHYAYGLFDQSHFTKDYKMFVIDNLGAKALYALDPVNFLYLLDFNAVTFEKLVSCNGFVYGLDAMSVKFKADLIAYRVEEKKIDKLIKAYVNRKRSKTMAKIKILMTNYL